ncbi:MAG: hypothetical protein UY00_C0071G0007, partial [Candidatus Wolfebacteria bacterium GW2011_GWA1_47_6]
MSLEELEKKLYGIDRKDDGEDRVAPQVKHQEEPSVQTTWGDDLAGEDVVAKKMGKGTRAFIISSIFLLLGIGGVSYYYISEYYKTKDLLFAAQTEDSVLIAHPFEITVDVENRSQAILREAKIFIKLPDGVIGIGNDTERQTIEEAIGDMDPGEVLEKTYSVVVVKDAESTKKLDVNFSYLPQNINTRFEREETLEVHVGEPAIALDFTTPQNVFSTENFDIGMRYRNISDMEFKDVVVKLIMPDKVALKSASREPDSGTTLWKIDALASQTEQIIAVKAAFEGANQEFFELRSQVVVLVNGKEYVINEKTANLGIAASPLSLDIVANSNPSYIARPAEAITYTLKYRNNTDVALSDVIMKAKIKGEMFDLATVQSRGSFDSVTNTLMWNASGVPELKLIEPGREGSVDFVIQTKGAYPIKRMFDKNFTLKVDGEINSPTVPYNVASDKTIGFASNETKVSGSIGIEARVAQTLGAQVPEVNKPLKYTVTMTIKNYATDMRDVRITSSLQPGVRWTGVVKSNSGAVPTYNDRTGEINWTIDKIIATKGVIGTPTEATFQVEIT